MGELVADLAGAGAGWYPDAHGARSVAGERLEEQDREDDDERDEEEDGRQGDDPPRPPAALGRHGEPLVAGGGGARLRRVGGAPGAHDPDRLLLRDLPVGVGPRLRTGQRDGAPRPRCRLGLGGPERYLGVRRGRLVPVRRGAAGAGRLAVGGGRLRLALRSRGLGLGCEGLRGRAPLRLGRLRRGGRPLRVRRVRLRGRVRRVRLRRRAPVPVRRVLLIRCGLLRALAGRVGRGRLGGHRAPLALRAAALALDARRLPVGGGALRELEPLLPNSPIASARPLAAWWASQSSSSTAAARESSLAREPPARCAIAVVKRSS